MEDPYNSASPSSTPPSSRPLSPLLRSSDSKAAGLKPIRKRWKMTRKRLAICILALLVPAACAATGTAIALKKRCTPSCRAEGGCRDLGYAKYQGVRDPHGVTSWYGMRYAAPPIGELRFAAPQDPGKVDGIQLANVNRNRCLSTSTRTNSQVESEDCLFVDVFAPTNATENSKLPVYFFIQGGGFNQNANPKLNASGLIQASGGNMVVVGFNYRVGLYGFLASKEIEKHASLNNGLKDQIKALEWVKRHIKKFGGNPDHVVIGGHSAGGASCLFHLTAYGGKKEKCDEALFHGVIAGSPSMGNMFTVSESQFLYDSLVQRTGCDKTEKTLDCLRKMDSRTLQSHNSKQPFPGASKNPLFLYSPTIDGDLVPDYTYRLLQEGKFCKVPVVFGDDQNEGTLFASRRANTVQDTNEFLVAQFPALKKNQLERINRFFPPTQQEFPGSGKYWQQLANAYGDMRYTCPKIATIESFTESNDPNQVWSYRYAVEDPIFVKSGLGTPHTAELEAIWGPDYNPGKSPGSYYTTNKGVVPVVQGYWSSFIRALNPNTHRANGAPEWKTWNVSSSDPQAEGFRELFIRTGDTKMRVVDSEQREICDYLISIGVDIKQ
ncbi:conserved hypothetical protein [Uncinocarpus reesii 1704]|uniref:Carboxylic ester hydrolase n=1 Tax=Uncinocarpus reesii (strain UAMH 1704) TaxID=336963 RepID=C4JIF2_UNCRE|nr:uncharacterized protein UREG_01489 [Uncinocarpus reesii 1704]EEP76640.1 conserved hypothetical protein [Uncinocarpus reesii 1704]